MIKRSPKRYVRYAKGMPGGPRNPLGARALYLYRDGKDTMYRIHGTTEPWSIGQSVSNGCIRMINDHVIALYEVVPVGRRRRSLTDEGLRPPPIGILFSDSAGGGRGAWICARAGLRRNASVDERRTCVNCSQ